MKLKKMKKIPCNSSACLRDLKKLMYLPIEKQSLEAETCGTSNESSTKNESLAIERLNKKPAVFSICLIYFHYP